MPIFSFACPKCKKDFEKFIHNLKEDLWKANCPDCTTESIRVLKPCNISYGVAPVSAKGEYMPGLGRTFSNTFEYKKALDSANQMEASPKELREFQQRKKADSKDVFRKSRERVKKQVMSEIQAGKIRSKKSAV